jgi:hypothetical protein
VWLGVRSRGSRRNGQRVQAEGDVESAVLKRLAKKESGFVYITEGQWGSERAGLTKLQFTASVTTNTSLT